jgi:16S rRNA (guanine527-N7)-methyltransferase
MFELLNRHVSVSRETYDRLTLYYDLLVKWQAKVNLVGPDTISQAWQRHFLDSLQLQQYIENKNAIIADIGTGAGFPGMALAILGYKNIHLIESDAKKITFLREVARITNTSVSIHHGRVENILIDNISFILSRACAPLDQLFSYSKNFVSHETICLFHKGKNYSKDIEDAKLHWLFEAGVFPSIVDTESVVLKIINLRKRVA